MAYKVLQTYDANSIFFWLWKDGNEVKLIEGNFTEIQPLTGKKVGPFTTHEEILKHFNEIL